MKTPKHTLTYLQTCSLEIDRSLCKGSCSSPRSCLNDTVLSQNNKFNKMLVAKLFLVSQKEKNIESTLIAQLLFIYFFFWPQNFQP